MSEHLAASPEYGDVALLDPVRAPESMGVYASTGPNFSHTVFGRDSIVVGEKIYDLDQQLAHDIILTLASLQGTQDKAQNEEEVGKIHHEYRTTKFGDILVPDDSITIMHKLLDERNEPDADEMYHYDTADATPLFIRFVKKYTDKYGVDILSESYTDKDGATRKLEESVHGAADWLVGKLQQRDDRLLSYRRTNPGSIANQVWKDSVTSHMFSDGTLPDFEHDVVSVELQGYAYDALQAAAHFFPEDAAEYRQLGDQVQRSTIEKLWMPEEQFFAQGLATHQDGGERVLDTLTSDAALLLDSQLLKDLPERASDIYVNGIENMILGPEFLTPAGVRCRALRHANLLPYVDYHGSLAVWAKETSEVARGLENFGRYIEAITLHNAIIDSFQTAGDFYELFYVGTDNTVSYDPHEGVARFSSPKIGEPLPTPEPGQAWSIAAAIVSWHRLRSNLELAA